MGADWNQIITRAGEFFPTIAAPVAIIFGIGIAMWIMDWLLDRFAGVRSGNDHISDSPVKQIPRLSRTPRSSAASAGRTRAPASSNSTTPANTAGTSTSGTTTRGTWGGGG